MAIIVADIHGCVEKVKAFLAHRPKELHVCLGDVVDSDLEPPIRQIECLNLLLDSDSVMLFGNHELSYIYDIPYAYSCSGHIEHSPVPPIVRANQHRFQAAYSANGYLLTHAGVCSQISQGCTNPDELAADFNHRLWNQAPLDPVGRMGIYELLKSGAEESRSKRDPILFASAQRGGRDPFGGIFWFDPLAEEGIDCDLKQVYGHREIKTEPALNDFGHINLNYFDRNVCYLFDTKRDEVVKIPIKPMGIKKVNKLFSQQVSHRISGSYYHQNWDK